jgi:hypothetical protein
LPLPPASARLARFDNGGLGFLLQEGERAYLVRTVVPAEHDGKYPRSDHVQVLGAKYPAELAILLETLLNQRPKTCAVEMIKSVPSSSLPRERKEDLLKRAAAHPEREISRWADLELKALEAERP